MKKLNLPKVQLYSMVVKNWGARSENKDSMMTKRMSQEITKADQQTIVVVGRAYFYILLIFPEPTVVLVSQY